MKTTARWFLIAVFAPWLTLTGSLPAIFGQGLSAGSIASHATGLLLSVLRMRSAGICATKPSVATASITLPAGLSKPCSNEATGTAR